MIRMRPHDVNRRFSSKFRKMVGADDRVGVVCMDWAAECRSPVGNLVEFESRVNDVGRRHKCG